MAIPKIKKLDYFPLKCDFFANNKIEILRSKFGNDGAIFFLMLLSNIYHKKGYYMNWNNDFAYLYKSKLLISSNETEITEMLIFMCKIGLFNLEIFEKYNILTSESIQLQYIEIMYNFKRTKWICVNEIWLFNNLLNDLDDKTILKLEIMNERKIFYSIEKNEFLVNSEKSIVNSEKSIVNSEKSIVNSEFDIQKGKGKSESVKVKEKSEKVKLIESIETNEMKLIESIESSESVEIGNEKNTINTSPQFDLNYFYNFGINKFKNIDPNWIKFKIEKWWNFRNPDWIDKNGKPIKNFEKDLTNWIYKDLENYMETNYGKKPSTIDPGTDAINGTGRSWTANDLLKN